MSCLDVAAVAMVTARSDKGVQILCVSNIHSLLAKELQQTSICWIHSQLGNYYRGIDSFSKLIAT